jgi:hypothetical protein
VICTEEEARKKWCPMGRTADSTGNSGFNMWSNVGNRHTEPLTWCVASECMWWAWVQEGMRAEDKPKPPTHGCCGYTHR